MILNSLSVTNFKNIRQANLEFSPKFNALLGNNGMGKSNLLDAVYYLSFTKSFTGLPDSKVITRGEQFTMIKGMYTRRNQQEEISFGYTEGKRKSFRRQGKEYGRLSAHIGLFPAVMVAPRDIELIHGPSDERRRFADLIISQTDPLYLDRLIRYNNALKQRNSLLRDHIANPDIYAAIEASMVIAAEYITERRASMAAEFRDIFNHYYRLIARTDETPSLLYSSASVEAGATLDSLLEDARRRDEILGHTTVGPHRDDLLLLIDDMPVKSAASQGQSKTFTIAMRLAQYDFTAKAVGLKPLLLLDDIFDKLDALRVANIVDIVNSSDFGQIFITDTNRGHLDSIMRHSAADYRLWTVESGNFTQL